METEMNGMSASVQAIASRSASLVVLFLACAMASPQAAGANGAGTLKSFHDDALNITYFYPSEFVPAPPASTPALAGASKCMRPTLFVYSVTPVADSSFAISTIDSTCPEIPRGASQLGSFTGEQILRQLKQYGEPAIIQMPTKYAIAGHPAAITVASVGIPAGSGKGARIIYAAKACVLGSVPLKTRKRLDPVEPVTHILCFDFTTQNGGTLTEMFSFIIQFKNSPLEPMFPGSAIRNIGEPLRR
jgi:hypothetical protein